MAKIYNSIDMVTACSLFFEQATRFPENRRMRLQTSFLFKAEKNGYVTPAKHKMAAFLVEDTDDWRDSEVRIYYAHKRNHNVNYLSKFADPVLVEELKDIIRQRQLNKKIKEHSNGL